METLILGTHPQSRSPSSACKGSQFLWIVGGLVGGPIGAGTADIAGWIRVLKPFVEETAASIGDIPAAAIEFGSPDPDTEIVRIQEHLKSIGLDLPKDF